VSLVTVSEKKGGREYHRHFDHDEAQKLYAEGRSINSLAEQFGVSHSGMQRVLDPEFRAKFEARAKAWIRENKREPCKGRCGRLVWMVGKRAGRTGYCRECFQKNQVVVNGNVRVDSLRCNACREWKPDAEYGTSHGSKSRRGRDPECRMCATKRRRDHRRRKPQFERDQAERVKAKRREQRMARYIVFQPNGAGFVEVSRVDAGSPAHAVEQAATTEGDYVAVPEGRFKLMRVAPVQRLKVVEASPLKVAANA
jgi:hypothetical protein